MEEGFTDTENMWMKIKDQGKNNQNRNPNKEANKKKKKEEEQKTQSVEYALGDTLNLISSSRKYKNFMPPKKEYCGLENYLSFS